MYLLCNNNIMTTSHDSEVPAHGQQVITACAFIHHTFDGVIKVFLPKRASTKKFLPNFFRITRWSHRFWGRYYRWSKA